MMRELLLAVAVLTVCTACAATGPPRSSAHTTPPTAGPTPTAGLSPATGPTGISSPDAARIGPLAPARLTAVADAGNVRLTWPATGEDVAYYQCLRRTTTTSSWELLGQTTPGDLSYLDRRPGNGTYVYGVRAVNTYHVASAITESAPITVG
jgi:hypothetical protein